MLPTMFNRLAQIALLLIFLSLPLLTKKEDDRAAKKTGLQILEEAIKQRELLDKLDGYSSDQEDLLDKTSDSFPNPLQLLQ